MIFLSLLLVAIYLGTMMDFFFDTFPIILKWLKIIPRVVAWEIKNFFG